MIFEGVVDIPDWVFNPEVDVAFTNSFGYASFFNTMTGERFDLPFELEVRARNDNYSWAQDGQFLNMNFDFDKSNVYQLDILSGKISRSPYQTPTPNITPPANQEGFIFTSKEIINTSTGEVVYVRKSGEDGMMDMKISFSPVSRIVMILRNPTPGAGSTPTFCECDLVFFDPATQTEIAVYSGNYQKPVWSPDGTQIGYLRPEIYGSGIGSDICVQEFESGTSRCYQVYKHFSGLSNRIILFKPRWSPDGTLWRLFIWRP